MQRLFQFHPEVFLFLLPVWPLKVGSCLQQERQIGAQLLSALLLHHHQYGVPRGFNTLNIKNLLCHVSRVLPAHLGERVLGHVGLEVAPLALDVAVGEDDDELVAPVDALHYVLRHRDANLGSGAVCTVQIRPIHIPHPP